MRSLVWLWVTAVVAGSVSCRPGEVSPQLDLEAERATLMDRDRAWSQTAGDAERFHEFWAEDGVFLPDGMPVVRGGEAIHAVEAEMFSEPGFSLTWSPTAARVSGSGDLGYTSGTFRLTTDDADGNPQTTVGKYLTAWSRSPGGDWMVVADCFNDDGPPGGEQP